MDKRTAICVVLILSVGSALLAIAEDRSKRVSAATAAANSVDIMGRELLQDWQSTMASEAVSLVTLTDTVTPFLTYRKREAYRVEMDNVPVTISKTFGPDTVTLEDQRDFEVYCDAQTGVLMKIDQVQPSYFEKVAKKEIRIPTAEESERQLRGRETIRGFPSANPQVSFLQILSVLPSNPLRADRITAVVAEITNYHGESQTVWIVDTYGVESIGGHKKLETYQINHIRSLVDASTGSLISWSNSPYVVESDGQ